MIQYDFSVRLAGYGGFQLEFVSISRVINHMTCYNFECSRWWKIYLKKILYKICSPLGLNVVFSTNQFTPIIAGLVIYTPAYTYKFQLKDIYHQERRSYERMALEARSYTN